jgi:hypothetical protein
MSASSRQWIVCAGVVAGHLGVLLLFSHTRPLYKGSPSDWSMEVILIPHPEDQEKSPPPHPVPRARHLERRATPAPASAPVVLPSETAPQPSDESRPSAITDWSASTHGAVDDALRREREKADRGSFDHAFPTPPPADKPGVFGSEKENRRAGRIEADGSTFWIRDNCYFEVARGPKFPGELQMPMVPICKPPPTGGGEHMFDHLAPNYLKKPEDGQASK